MSLEITKIEVKKFEQDNLKAFVNVTFNGELTVNGFKIMDGKNGLWLAPPSIKKKDGWSNVTKLSKELQTDLQEQALEEFDKGGSSGSGSRESSGRESTSRRRR